MIKGNDSPGNRALVAVEAVCGRKGRACRGVRRVVGLLPGSEVAAGVAAIRRRDLQIVIIINVASLASQIRVAVRQQEPRFAVIKFRAQPTIKIMATLAVGGSKLRVCHGGGLVWRVGGVLPILQVAGIALR